jgi:Holliday junction resolvasome RuvABC endonuclease subunit
MQISQDLQHRPIVFIRFNPDAYTNKDGIVVKSCWKMNKLDVMQIMKTKEKEWEERIEALKQQIQYWIDNPTVKTVEIIELFY